MGRAEGWEEAFPTTSGPNNFKGKVLNILNIVLMTVTKKTV